MKFALICFGNEESYGLLFVGGELIELGQDIHYFDAEMEDVTQQVVNWKPDYIMFSPMSTFFQQAYNICKELKQRLPNVVSVFGGHHAVADPEISKLRGIDAVVVGPVKGSIQRLIKGERGLIITSLTTPDDLPKPARKEYYKDIPRMATRYRKVMLSRLGCPFNCTYCSSSCGHMQNVFGVKEHQKYFLGRRPLKAIIEEAKEIIKYPTTEIEWVDDDMFCGQDAETFLPEFIEAWNKEINLPMYISTTSIYALRVSDKILKDMRKIVNCIGMGIQAINPESLKLFNRAWDNKVQMKKAYDKLKSFGYNINLQCIVGLPVKDPIADALETIKGMQKIGPGSIISCYPLQIYKGTAMEKIVQENGYKLNKDCCGDTNTGVTGIDFSQEVVKKLKNICKLATMFVKFNVDEDWMKALIEINLDEDTSKHLSMVRYKNCVIDRLGKKGEQIFDEILKGMHLRY